MRCRTCSVKVGKGSVTADFDAGLCGACVKSALEPAATGELMVPETILPPKPRRRRPAKKTPKLE